MIVLTKDPGKDLVLAEIPNTLEALQEAVGGHIEVITCHGGYAIICNEDGKLLGLPPSLVMDDGEEIVGPVLFAGVDGSDLCSIPTAVACALMFRYYKLGELHERDN